MSELRKSVSKDDFSHLESGSDEYGPMIVSHRNHLGTSDKYVADSNGAADFKDNVLDHPDEVHAINRNFIGSAPKLLFNLQSGYKMVKPYHEKPIQEIEYARLPITGWAEMATQALFHAGGIGNLCGRTHVAELNSKSSSLPVTVTHFDPLATEYFLKIGSYHKHLDPSVYDNVAKIGMMDYLTSNNDRNYLNMLFKPPTPMFGLKDILAIDHGRSFQYAQPNRFSSLHLDKDHLFYYIGGYQGKSATSCLVNKFADESPWNTESISHACNWWKYNNEAVKAAMNTELGSIIHPDVQHHIRENFNARAHSLDRFVQAWEEEKNPQKYNPYDNMDENEFMVHVPGFKTSDYNLAGY